MPTEMKYGGSHHDDGFAEDAGTIALLQEEIARLEDEIRLRDEAIAGREPAGPVAAEPGEAERKLAELSAELASRDETIELLWDQVRRFEEAEEAGRSEWEHLQGWVEELERRVEGQATPSADLGEELEAERRRSEVRQWEADAERRAWAAQRRCLEDEVAALRARASEAGSDGRDAATIGRLEGENQRLREECRRLAAAEAAAAEVASLREQVDALRAERDEARRQLAEVADQRHRERLEHQAELNELRSRLALQSARPKEGELSPDERTRALRQHLLEIHERQVRERKGRTLSARLAGLWGRTGSGR